VEHKEIFKAVKLQDAYGMDSYGVEGMSKGTFQNLTAAGLLVGILFVLGLLFFLFTMFTGSSSDSSSAESTGIPSLPSSFSSIF
jgi:hypothetical protein